MAYSSSSSPEIFPAPTTEIQDRFSYKHATHDDVLEDLSSRFILNLPDEELASLERICFQVEQAHWFYEDFIREENPKFPSLPLKKFSAMLFHACPLLHQWSHDHEQAFNTFMQYKTRVPVCGAIMLNDTWEKCILVKGWKSSSGWGFPKGKINEDEPEHVCAMREVLEETGYNLAGQINPEDVIQMSIKEQKISLYIVPGVPEDFEFKTRTRKEISRIEWFKLTDLPTWKRNKAAPGKFYLISPFIGALKAFINERKPRGSGRKSTKPNNIQSTQGVRKDIHSSQPNPKCHSHAQGSSSQSSSQDNCDPQTPSPQYCEPSAHTSDGRVPLTMANIAAAIDIQALDPHFARLLSSLSSTTEVLDNQGNDKPVLGLSVKELSPPTSKTPVPAAASTHSHTMPDAADWSSSVPTNLSNRPTGHIPFTHSGPMLEGSPISPPSQPSHRSSTPPTETQHNGIDVRSGSQIPSSTVFSAMSNLSNPTQSLSSRRTSSTADISPYLSRPTEMPTSGKRLKQLALLETVADESARMTPILAKRELQLPRLNRYPIGSHCGPPPVTTSMNDLHVIYSSGPGAVQGAATPPAPPCAFNSHSHLYSVHDDPFQVKMRAGEAYHRGSSSMFHPPPPSIGRQVSVPQSQLVPGPTGIYPSPHQMQGYRLPFPPVPQQGSHHHMPSGLPSQLGGHAPHVLSPSQSVPAPHSAHAVSPGFDLPIPLNPSGSSSSLLSILNGGRSSGTNGSS